MSPPRRSTRADREKWLRHLQSIRDRMDEADAQRERLHRELVEYMIVLQKRDISQRDIGAAIGVAHVTVGQWIRKHQGEE